MLECGEKMKFAFQKLAQKTGIFYSLCLTTRNLATTEESQKDSQREQIEMELSQVARKQKKIFK